MLSDRKPSVTAGKDIRQGISPGLPPAELAAPGHTSPGVCTGTGVAVLSITGSLLIGRIIPVVPPRRENVTAKLAPHEESGSIRTPWPAEKDSLNPFRRREPAPVEDIPVIVVSNGGGSCYI